MKEDYIKKFFNFISPSPQSPIAEERKSPKYDNQIESLRVKYGKEKRLWDIINFILIIIILVWILLFVVYYVQGKIKWSESY